jgi:hypothetical protein
VWIQPASIFSGHYMAHGLTVQAICDSDCCFTFFGVVAPGKASDQVAFEQTSIHQGIMALPMGKYLVGDAAYQVSNVLLAPFTGSQREDAGKDEFNFFSFTASHSHRNGVWLASNEVVCPKQAFASQFGQRSKGCSDMRTTS